jgi:hypothetical protein
MPDGSLRKHHRIFSGSVDPETGMMATIGQQPAVEQADSVFLPVADNVFFDEHSFQQDGQAVFINIENALCRSMDWSGALYSPTLTTTSNTNNLRIHGSLVLNAEMNFAWSGITYFEGNSAEGDTHAYYDGRAIL